MKKESANNSMSYEGIIPINKPRGMGSFNLVRLLRKHLGIRKIGHAGTLDPFAEGVMLMLIGRQYTRLSDLLLKADKEYVGRIRLGEVTDTFDCDGRILHRSDINPSQQEVKLAIQHFQGEILQTPPMYSAKKKNGKKLYELARQGKTVEREPVRVKVATELLDYTYPHIDIRVSCSKGTYIRAIAYDIGEQLGCGGHLSTLTRTKSGFFTLADCFDGSKLLSPDVNLQELQNNLFDTAKLALKGLA